MTGRKRNQEGERIDLQAELELDEPEKMLLASIFGEAYAFKPDEQDPKKGESRQRCACHFAYER
jgi:hypothetical protein